jgi:hypothetical protein
LPAPLRSRTSLRIHTPRIFWGIYFLFDLPLPTPPSLQHNFANLPTNCRTCPSSFFFFDSTPVPTYRHSFTPNFLTGTCLVPTERAAKNPTLNLDPDLESPKKKYTFKTIHCRNTADILIIYSRRHSFNQHHGRFIRWWTSPRLLQLCVSPTISYLHSTTNSSTRHLARPIRHYATTLEPVHAFFLQYRELWHVAVPSAPARRVAVCLLRIKSKAARRIATPET